MLMKMASTTASSALTLAMRAAKVEGDAERDRRQRVTEVVDQVGEKRPIGVIVASL